MGGNWPLEKSRYISAAGCDDLISMGLTFSPCEHGLTLINESIISIPVSLTVKASSEHLIEMHVHPSSLHFASELPKNREREVIFPVYEEYCGGLIQA